MTQQEEHWAIAQARQMAMDNFDNMLYDFRQQFINPLDEANKEIEKLREENERLKQLGGQSDDYEWSICLENLQAFYEAAGKRDDVDALMWIQHRLNSDWEQKDYFDQPGTAEYSGAEIRKMLVERNGCNPEAVYIDDSRMYKVQRSPGGTAGIWRMASWGNAYYYKGMCHYAGVESVAITNFGSIMGVEERVLTAGSQGIVDRFLRTYVSDPGDVLERLWNNQIIWPAMHKYTEIRF